MSKRNNATERKQTAKFPKGKSCKCENSHNTSTPCEKTHNGSSSCESSHMRLNRALAATGLCSRRKADELILSGKIEVNGKQILNPAIQVSPSDMLSYNGSPLSNNASLSTYMLYKPAQTVCTVSDPQGRKTVLDLLPAQLRKLRLYPVGRLDYFSEGLLLLTNDGNLAFRLAHPSHHVRKIYEVTIRGPLPEEAIRNFRSGFTLPNGKKLLPIGIETKTLAGGDTLARMELREGVNRQIRRMCDAYRLVILKLKRVSEGPLLLGSLKPGQFRKLAPSELASLRSEV